MLGLSYNFFRLRRILLIHLQHKWINGSFRGHQDFSMTSNSQTLADNWQTFTDNWQTIGKLWQTIARQQNPDDFELADSEMVNAHIVVRS